MTTAAAWDKPRWLRSRGREFIHQSLSISGLLLLGSFGVTAYVAIYVSDRPLTDLITWNGIMLANYSGRWIIPKIAEIRQAGEAAVGAAGAGETVARVDPTEPGTTVTVAKKKR